MKRFLASLVVVGVLLAAAGECMSPEEASLVRLEEDLGDAKSVAVAVHPKQAAKAAVKHKAAAPVSKVSAPKLVKTKKKKGKVVSQKAVAKAAKKVSKKAHDALDKAKQRDLEIVEKMLKHPVINPRSERAYKRAAEKVDKSKKAIESKLAKVEQMSIVANKLAGTAMERA